MDMNRSVNSNLSDASVTAALILAAGCLGDGDKYSPTDSIFGASSVRRLIKVFRHAGLERIVVITGHDAGHLERHCANMGAIFIRNDDYETGDMLSSVKVGLRYLMDKCAGVFILPFDIPFVSVETIEKMATISGAPVVVPVYDGKPGHPLLLSRDLFDDVIAYESEGGLSGALLGQSRCLYEVGDQGILIDVQEEENPEEIAKQHSLRKLHPGLWVSLNREKEFFGPDALKLLSLTDETGSLKLASRYMGVSYSKGIMMIADMEEQLGYKVITSQQGGKNGGGSEITEEGRALMTRYEAFADECTRHAEEAFKRHFADF